MIETSRHWAVSTLGDLATPRSDRRIPGPECRLPFIGMEHVVRDTGVLLDLPPARGVRSAAPRVFPGDVLYGRLRPYLNKVTVSPLDAYASGEFIVLKCHTGVDPRFLRWRLATHDFADWATSLNTGDRPRVKWGQIKQFEISLPGLEEQRRIVERLEEHLGRLTAARSSLESATRKISVLPEAHSAALIDAIKREHQAANRALGDVLERQQGGTLIAQGWSPKCESRTASGDHEWGVLKTTSIQYGHFLPQENKALPAALHPRPAIAVEPGDILLTRAGPRARCGVSCLVTSTTPRLMLSDKMYRLRADTSKIRPEFLALFLRSPDARRELDRMKTGISESGLNLTQSRLLTLRVPVPSLQRQDEILAASALMSASSVEMHREADQSLLRLLSLRRALLVAAFSGELAGSMSNGARRHDRSPESIIGDPRTDEFISDVFDSVPLHPAASSAEAAMAWSAPTMKEHS